MAPPDNSKDIFARRASVKAQYVDHDQIAYLHGGEVVIAGQGTPAHAARIEADANAVIHYHFPVEVEVRAAPDPQDPEELVALVLGRLSQELENG